MKLKLTPLGALVVIVLVAATVMLVVRGDTAPFWELAKLIAAGITGYLSRSTEAGAASHAAGQDMDGGADASDGAQKSTLP